MKCHVFENIERNERFGPQKLLLDAHLIRGFSFAVDDFSPEFYQTAQICGPLAPPALLAKKLLHIFMTKYEPQGVSAVHFKDDIEFFSAPKFGDEVVLTAEYTDIFVKKGRTCVVLDGEARDSLGNLLLKHRSVEIVPADEKHNDDPQKDPSGLSHRLVNTEIPAGAKIAERAESAHPGDRLPMLQKTINQDQMSVFVGANEGWKNIHTDIDVARAAGFEKTIMSGMIQACWLTHHLHNFFGATFYETGRLGITFLKNVCAGDTVEIEAVLRNILEDGRAEVEFWTKTQNGETTSVGWASAMLARPSTL